MKIGVLSDTHDRVETTRSALDLFRERGAELLIHCGDICEPSIISEFKGWSVHFVFGNNDGRWIRESGSKSQRDFRDLTQAMEAIQAKWQHPFGHLELAGAKIAWTHGDNFGLLADLERSGAYDYLFFGHTHQPEARTEGRTRVINPGALHRARPKSCAMIDLESGGIEHIVVR